MTRAVRNCTSPDSLERELNIISHRLHTRGYPHWSLNRAKNIVRKKSRSDLINPSTRKSINRPSTDKPTLVVEYSSQFPQIKEIVDKYLPILMEDDALSEILRYGWQTVSRRPRTLGNILSPSFFSWKGQSHTWLRQQGFYKCAYNPCKTCKYAFQCKEFKNSDESCTYKIKQFINCNSQNVVYVIRCEICKLNYVGCTTTKLKTRALEHLYDIAHSSTRNLSGASRHFVDIHQSNVQSFKIYGIEKMYYFPRGGDIRSKLKDREAFWILMLNSTVPHGLNMRHEVMFHY